MDNCTKKIFKLYNLKLLVIFFVCVHMFLSIYNINKIPFKIKDFFFFLSLDYITYYLDHANQIVIYN